METFHKDTNYTDYLISCDNFGGLFTEEYLIRLLTSFTFRRVNMSENLNAIGVPDIACHIANRLKVHDNIHVTAQEICQAGTVRELYNLISSRY
jgi:hypothetical protein